MSWQYISELVVVITSKGEIWDKFTEFVFEIF